MHHMLMTRNYKKFLLNKELLVIKRVRVVESSFM